MSDRRPRGIEIPEEVARAADVPDDLDSTQREPYTIPSTRRRRIAAWIYLAAAVLAALGVVAGLPRGLLTTSGLLAVIGVWHLAAAWDLAVLDAEALDRANREVPMAVGHASAAVGFDGWRARPVWNVLVFSAEDPPDQRGLIRVDAVDGKVLGTYVEQV